MGTTSWIIDHSVDLTETCEKANWHRTTAIDALMATGITRADAEAFVEFAFTEKAKVADCRPEDCVSDEQYERITLG